MYADPQRQTESTASSRRTVAESVGGMTGPASAALVSMQQALNAGSAVQAQARMGQALNRRPAVVAQMKLARTLSGRTAIQRAETRGIPASLQGKSVQRAEAPVQRIPSWLGKVATLGAIGTIGASAYAGLKAGAFLGSYGGVGGAILGGTVGTVGGLLAGGWGVLRAKAAFDQNFGPKPLTAPLSIEQIIDTRSHDLKKRDKGGKDAELEYLEPGLRDAVRRTEKVSEAREAIRSHYRDQIAAPGQYQADTKYNTELSEVLRRNPLMKEILNGDLLTQGDKKPEGKQKDEEDSKDSGPAVEQGNLAIPDDAPSSVKEAKRMFDRLVAPRKLPKISSISRSLRPESAMGHEGDLHLGVAAPSGVVLHEFGHHLEQNLLPHEIASVHNFLRARSKSDKLRPVGPEPDFYLPQTSTGYDIEAPNLKVGGPYSATGLVGNAARYFMGGPKSSEKGSQGINRYVMASSDRPDVSYSTKVYGTNFYGVRSGGLDTEYLSTTIHFFSDPAAAEELVSKDPLRVCLFLSVAQPAQYKSIAVNFQKSTGQDLNKLIHRIGGE